MFNFPALKILQPNDPLVIFKQGNEPYLELIAGDASDRRFYRLKDNNAKNAICMQFPKWGDGYGGDPISWIGMQHALIKMGLPVPNILEVDENYSCIWTEDLGDTFLNSLFKESILDIKNPACDVTIQFYKKALDLLVRCQYPMLTVDHPAIHRAFDFEKLFFEMEFFIEHFLNGFLELNIHKETHEELYKDFSLLCKNLDLCERVLCHRDYHVRNIMISNEQLYWIDFQDARMGPHTYDVVSLIRDSYVPITWETRQELFNFYLKKVNNARQTNGKNVISESNYQLEILLMGLQRNIKAIGSFGYLATKKLKSNYLKYIHQTLNIIASKEAQIHAEIDLRHMLPNIFSLITELTSGVLMKTLNDKINQYLG